MSKWFELDHSRGVARLTLSRPDAMNTLSLAMIRELRGALERLESDGRTRVLVLASTGRHFSAGMQLEEFAGQPDLLDVGSGRGRLAFQSLVRELMQCFAIFDQVRFPVIAAIQGGCIGGALDLVAACDLRVATDDAFFVIQEINLGLVADLGTLQRLPKLIPPGIVREYAYTGRRMDASRALELGLLNAVYPDVATMQAGVEELAGEIAARSPLAIAGTKTALNYARDHSVAESLDQMAVLQSAIFSPEEITAAVAAMRSKQVPRFEDLSRAPAGDPKQR
jgi:enoyl-CoA hydratase